MNERQTSSLFVDSLSNKCRDRSKRILPTVGIAVALITSLSAQGAQLSLSQSPLFVTGGAPANIFVTVDDSGSMDWNMVAPDIEGGMSFQMLHTGTAQSASNTGTGSPRVILANTASSTDNQYTGMLIKITGGTGTGQQRSIIAYDGAARRATVNLAWEVVPDNTSTYTIHTAYFYLFPQGEADLNSDGDTVDANESGDNAFSNGTFSSYGKILPSEAAVSATAGLVATASGVWRGRFSGYNKLYYNPNVNYQPWPGVDDAGNPFPNAKPATGAIAVTALRMDPFRSTGPTLNITQNLSWIAYKMPNTGGTTTNISVTGYYPAQYYTWTDSNVDGVVDASDGHTLYEIRDGASCGGATSPCMYTNRSAVRTDCAIENGDGTRNCTADEELKNFANWFMYFRRRELASKNAIASVINPAGTDIRMGYGNINSTTNNTQIALMNTSNSAGAKRTLLDAIFRTQSSGGTPLRTALDRTGKYFECVNGSIFGNTSSYTCPWLSAAQGGTCQQSFTILTTDGYYNDFSTFTGPGNVDADGNSPNAAGDTNFDGGTYADTYLNTLADVAMHYYERDLNGPLANNVPVLIGVDNATHQHMTTYTVGFGVSGTLTKNPGESGAPSPYVWPNPTTGDAAKIDDMRHAAYNGRGKFLSASDPDGLANALRSSVENIAATTGSASAVAVNSRTLTVGTIFYQARFTSAEWSGDLRAALLDPVTLNSTLVWSAGDLIKTQGSRVFLTYRRTGFSVDPSVCNTPETGSSGGVAFNWGNLSETQQCLLNDNPESAAFDDDTKGTQRASWLRGSTSLEGPNSGQLRVRAAGFKLGDIANSTPVYVGAPEGTMTDAGYAAFRALYATRPAMLYDGANDGMLHGFSASSGAETMTYIPSMVYPKLNKLTDTLNYRGNHQYYVDGSPTVGDAFGAFDSTFAGKNTGCAGAGCWRSVLVSGLAGGGKGVFALDVTDPQGTNIPGVQFNESNAANIALWEFNDSASPVADDDMGYVYGEISIAKMRDGTWAAVFGNGYNSVNENAVLYIVNIANGALIRKIVLNNYGGTTNSNGLSAPTVYDRDSDGFADAIYAGDLRGNLWKVDVSDADPNNWQSAYLLGSNPRPMFQAVDGTTATTVAQTITAKPAVATHPDTTNYPNTYLVYVGTGRYVTTSDKNPASSPINTMYGIWDRNVNGTTTPVTRANLLVQSITQSGSPPNATRGVSNNAIDWTTHQGWALNLRTNQTDSLGEFSVTNPVFFRNSLIFTTGVPVSDVCTFGGSGWLMIVRASNGGNSSTPVFDTNGDGEINSADDAGIAGINPGIGLISEPVILEGTSRSAWILSGSTGATRQGGLCPVDTQCEEEQVPGTGSVGTGRRSWKQLR